MKNKALNQRNFKFEYLVLFLFLSLKYYLFTKVFTSEVPTFGLNGVREITVFLLSVIHIFLCTAVLIKIKNHFSDNIIILSLLVTDPFYTINFYSPEALSVAIVFEFLVLIFSERNKILSMGLFAIICAASPVLMSVKAPSFIVFVIFVVFLLAEKWLSHKTALRILITGAVSSIVGYSIVFIMKFAHLTDGFFATQYIEPVSESKIEFAIYRIVFCALLVVFEIVFWAIQISSYKENKKNRNRQSNFKNSNKIKGEKNEEKFADTEYLLYIVLGIITCAVSVVSLAIGSVYNAPAAMMSITVCLIVLSKHNPSKISKAVEKNSLLVAIILIVINSFFTKGLFESSEIMTIINQFAPM